MTPKTMKSSGNPTNRAQIERGLCVPKPETTRRIVPSAYHGVPQLRLYFEASLSSGQRV